jgi:hypothetical protein
VQPSPRSDELVADVAQLCAAGGVSSLSELADYHLAALDLDVALRPDTDSPGWPAADEPGIEVLFACEGRGLHLPFPMSLEALIADAYAFEAEVLAELSEAADSDTLAPPPLARTGSDITVTELREAWRSAARPVCPDCGARQAQQLVYGYPAGPLSAGQILAGCIVTGNDPDWRCSDCGHQW